MASNENNTEHSDLIDVGDVDQQFSDEITDSATDRTPAGDLLGYEQQESGPAIADIRDRFAAFSIDILCLYILYWPAMLIFRTVALGNAAGPIPAAGTTGLVFQGLFLLLALLWFVLPEMVINASLGKLLCRLIVKKNDGTHPSFISVLLRNIFRPIDIILFPLLILSASMEWTAWHRRIGDVVGGTVVLRKLGNPPKQYALTLDIIATATRRGVAFVIDFALLASFVFGYGLLLDPEYPLRSMLILVMLPPAMIAFYVLPEWLFKTSPGKWILGMTICHEEGAAIDLPGAMIRTLWRPFDNNPFGFLTALFSIRRQRPGDVAASTVIIRVKRELKGFLGLIIWIILSASIVYVGLDNRDNFLAPDFQINFLPSIDLAKTGVHFRRTAMVNLSIHNFSFAEGEAKKPRRPSIYEPGETVYLLFDVDGYTIEESRVWIQEDLAISYPDGSIGLKLENINDFNKELDTSGVIRFENNIALPNNAQPGRYTVTLTIRDKLANRDIKEQRFFYVTPSSTSKPGKGSVTPQPSDSEGPRTITPKPTSGPKRTFD